MVEPILAVIDTNVFVSALISSKQDTATVRVLRSILQSRITPVYCKEILDEYREVLSRPKFKQTEEKVNRLIEDIVNAGIEMSPTAFDQAMTDEKDRVFYEVSLTGDSYLVTGNVKHFPIAHKVVTPSEMMEILDSRFPHTKN